MLERALDEVVRRHDVAAHHLPRGGRRAGAGDRPLRRLRAPGGGPLGAPRRGARGGGAGARRRASEARVRSTSRRARSSAPRCCGWAPRTTCCCSAMHHIVCDAWSMGVFQRELSALYDGVPRGVGLAARRRSRCSTPTTPPGSASSCRRALERQLAYWRRQLAGAPELLELPTDRPRPPVPSFRGAPGAAGARRWRCWTASARWRRRRAPRCTWCCWRAFQVLLAPVRGQRDVSVGTPIAGRTRARGRGADRLLREHPGAAHRPFGRPHLPRGAGPGARGDARRLRSTRTCRSSGWWRSCGPSAASATPRSSRCSSRCENADRRCGRARRGAGAGRSRSRASRRPPRSTSPSCSRPTRAAFPARWSTPPTCSTRHRPADGGAPGAGAGAGRRGCGRSALAAGAARRGGARAGAGGLEPHGARDLRPAGPRALRRVGAPRSGGHRPWTGGRP